MSATRSRLLVFRYAALAFGCGWATSSTMLLSPSLVHGADPEVRSAVEDVFDAGWKKSFSALDAAQEIFDERAGNLGDTAPLRYAMALLQIKHRKNQAAAATLQELLEASPDDLRKQRVYIGVLVTSRKYEQALLQGQAVAVALRDAPDADSKLSAETARFLGRVYGFLEGPGVKSVKEDLLQEKRAALLETLPTGLHQAFESGREAVLAKHEELSLSREGAAAEAKEAGEQEKERLAEKLGQDESAVQSDKEQIISQEQAARERYDSEMSGLNKQIGQAETALAAVTAQAQQVSLQLAQVEGDIDRWLAQGNLARDRFERDRCLRQADRLRPTANEFRRQLGALEAQAAPLARRLQDLQQTRQGVQNRFDGELNTLGRAAGKVRKAEARIASDQKKLSKPVATNTPKVRSQAAIAAVFSTYETVPLEEEKQRLLDSLK